MEERNQLQHALNGNIDIPAATFATTILASITYLMRRNRTMVVTPNYNEEGVITGVTQHTANPTVADIMEENTQAEAAVQTVGQALAEIVNTMRNEHRTLQQQLQANQQEFKTRLAADNCQRDVEERERARLRPLLPKLKMDPPEYYEGDPTEVDAWLQKMMYYFNQVRFTSPVLQIGYAIQCIRKGPGNQATNWSNSKITETAAHEGELAEFHVRFPGRTCTREQGQTGVPEGAATDDHPIWPAYTFKHKPPFLTWEEFTQECRQYFLMTET